MFVSPLNTVMFVLTGTLLWFSFFKAWRSDPGLIMMIMIKMIMIMMMIQV